MISEKEIERIARLSRIELNPGEKRNLEKDLSGILDFVAKLNEVDTGDVRPLPGGTDLVNVMRDDKVQKPVYRGGHGLALIDAAPRKRNGFVETKAVFDHDQSQ